MPPGAIRQRAHAVAGERVMSPREVATFSLWLAAQAVWGSRSVVMHLVDMAGYGPVSIRQKARAALRLAGRGELIGERRGERRTA